MCLTNVLMIDFFFFYVFSEEFWPTFMLLKWHQGGDADEMCDLDYADPALQVLGNPKKELAQLRASTGGLKLGAKLGNQWLHTHFRMFYWGSKSTWSCYTHQVKKVHTPSQALTWVIRQSRGGWQEEIAGVVKNQSDL